ncbi:MAG: UvrB/UvrC motif-containing protein [Crocinitomicaceae bacterium]|nr:UvrB/UvrC motif-containing protein [Crocinitomicaceae bacterium]
MKLISVIVFILFTFLTFGQELSTLNDAELTKLKASYVKTEDYKAAGKVQEEIKRRAEQISNAERIIEATKELETAISNEDYSKSAELKQEIEIRNKLEEAVKNEDYQLAANLKSELNSKKVEVEKATRAKNTSTNTPVEKVKSSPSRIVTESGILPPEAGKAVVYMTRVSGLGFAVDFKYFLEDQFIGKSKGVSYIRYEVDPGSHLFWAAGENQSFITLDAQAGKTYIIYIDVKMGAFSAQVNLTKVTPSEDERIKRALEVINSHKPSVTSQSETDKIVLKLNKRGYVQNKLTAYNTKWKGTKNYEHIDANSFIPESKLH